MLDAVSLSNAIKGEGVVNNLAVMVDLEVHVSNRVVFNCRNRYAARLSSVLILYMDSTGS
jgi:hypothetical protein